MSQDAAPPPEPPIAHQKVPLGSIVLIVVGALICLVSAAVVVGGGALVWAYSTQRDSQGYFTTSTERFETTSPAITSERIDLGTRPGSVGTSQDLGGRITVRLRVESTTGRAVFVGIARQQDVDRYLAGVAHAELQNVRIAPFSASYHYVDGAAKAKRAGDQPDLGRVGPRGRRPEPAVEAAVRELGGRGDERQRRARRQRRRLGGRHRTLGAGAGHRSAGRRRTGPAHRRGHARDRRRRAGPGHRDRPDRSPPPVPANRSASRAASTSRSTGGSGW